MDLDLKNKKIFLTGGNGFLGTYVVKELLKRGVADKNIFIPISAQYDLRKRRVCDYLVDGKDIVIHLAARVGGIEYNRTRPAQLFYDNASMALNLIDASYKAGVKKFVGIGSVCEYPKIVNSPFKEKDLWAGYPEETNAPYGLAKKMMLVQSAAYSQQYGFNATHLLMVNLYGPGDNFDPDSSHVIPALIRKVIEAKNNGSPFLEVWGTGKATREFLYVEDAARAIVLATTKYHKREPVNIGNSQEITIRRLVETICRLVKFKGVIRWDHSKPDGQPRRMLDVSLAGREFNFKAKTSLEKGLKKTINWYSKK